eukprot:8505670-Karenia_brevis.AAC.1
MAKPMLEHWPFPSVDASPPNELSATNRDRNFCAKYDPDLLPNMSGEIDPLQSKLEPTYAQPGPNFHQLRPNWCTSLPTSAMTPNLAVTRLDFGPVC